MSFKSASRPFVPMNNRGSNRGRTKQINKARSTKIGSGNTLRTFNPSQTFSLANSPVHKFRELWYPSATSMTVAGTNVAYTAATGSLTSTTTDARFSLYLQIGDSNNISATSAIYDQYRILEAKIHFFPQNTVSFYDGTDLVIERPVFTCVDYDDSSVPATDVIVMQFDNSTVHSPYKPFYVEFKPRVALPSGSGFANQSSQWIDMNNTTVQHYGMKGVFPSNGINHVVTWNIVAEVLYVLRSQR
jgi:hypothetical protein